MFSWPARILDPGLLANQKNWSMLAIASPPSVPRILVSRGRSLTSGWRGAGKSDAISLQCHSGGEPMPFMTRIPGVPDRDQIREGMAWYVGTGPDDKTCGDCALRGYYKDPVSYHGGCKKFRQLAGKHGPAVRTDYKACRYFEQQTNASRSFSGRS